ncbi:hypothetical protein K4K60_009537 [Colletotrichum sp. SAR11_57]|nr:hypothetical protein K4K60_009537 [Colletotrichum sp. SAR11_57]
MSDAWRAENKGPESLVAIITVTVLSTVFTGARLFVRGKILGKVHLDDYLIIASVICSWRMAQKVSLGPVPILLAELDGKHAFGAFVDAYLAIYPAVVLSKLQMSLKKKIALSVALGIGSM